MRKPFLMMGNLYVGPVCARKKNLIDTAKNKRSQVIKVKSVRKSRRRYTNLDLFEELENAEISAEKR
jgi:hypothetical protein